jgi:hypothetical protein
MLFEALKLLKDHHNQPYEGGLRKGGPGDGQKSGRCSQVWEEAPGVGCQFDHPEALSLLYHFQELYFG